MEALLAHASDKTFVFGICYGNNYTEAYYDGDMSSDDYRWEIRVPVETK